MERDWGSEEKGERTNGTPDDRYQLSGVQAGQNQTGGQPPISRQRLTMPQKSSAVFSVS